MTLPVAPASIEAKAVDVICVGESSLDFVAVVDRFPAPDAKVSAIAFEALTGGQAATAAVVCARQGWRAQYVGCLGQDAWGDTVAAALTHEGIGLSVARREHARTRTAIVLVEAATGRRTIVEHRDPRLRLNQDELHPAVITAGRIVLVDATDVHASIAAARAARRAGIPTVVDVDRPGADNEALLAEIDVVIVSASFATGVAGEAGTMALRKLAERFRPALTVITLGEAGSIALCRGTEIRTPAPQTRIVDTTGAGDAFRGGFISAWLEAGPSADVTRLLQHANATAALSCTGLGAQGPAPNREAVEALVTDAYGRQSK